ncbi:MAG: Ldh family oxidoreductase [Desulfobacterales bacterium]|nr:MAG: Ldh family oxidoreductase [Desulfobacterales bacterium]
MSLRYDAQGLIAFATLLLEKLGLPSERAAVVADILVEGDLMGHTTHGLQLLASYLKELSEGGMSGTGEPKVLQDRGAAVTWDGDYLPGPWLVTRAMELSYERMAEHPVMTVVVRRSHHIACLQAYLKRAADRGLVMILMSSDPSCGSVTPYGGCTPIYTPNPIAAGFPSDGEPILIDISTSTTTNGLTQRLYESGRHLPHKWLIDHQGRNSSDPAVLFTEPPGAILPLGGLESGHKGFALGLLVEALTASLGGFGRSDRPDRWGASVFMQIIDPAAFGGLANFKRETGWLAEACRNAAGLPGGSRVRLPGQRGLALRREYLANGVELAPTIMPLLEPWAEKLGVALPVAV